MSIPPDEAEVKDQPRWVGGAAAMLAVCITHPIDQTKIRSQVQRVRKGMLATMRSTVAAGGVRELWVGLSGSLLRQATYGAVRFGTYGELKARDERKRRAMGLPASEASAVGLIKNAAIAGSLAGLAGVPGELVLVRMSGDGVKPPDQRVNYRNAFHGLHRIYQEAGVPGMFRGAVPTTVRSILLNSAQLSCYDLIKRRLLRTGLFTDSIPLHLLTASLGGTISITICTPVDVIKSRVQADISGRSTMRVAADSLKRDGPGVLFRGWLPAWLRMTPTTALTFMFMEQISKLV